jgi:hypothetical protein
MSDNIKTISDDELEKMACRYTATTYDDDALTWRRQVANGFKAGFKAGQQAVVSWPSEEEVIAEAKSSTFKYIPNSIDYESGFVNCYDWLKERVMTGK